MAATSSGCYTQKTFPHTNLWHVISTVTGTGSLASGTTTDVTVPVGIKVTDVLVESGDAVVAGQELATLDQASVASALLSAKEELSDVEEEIEGLSSSASDTSSTEYLEALILDGKRDDLEKTIETLTALLESPAITASADGTIGTVSVSAGSETSTSSSSSSSGSSGSGTTSSGSSGSGTSSSTTAASTTGLGDGVTSTAAYQLGSSNASSATYRANAASTSWANLVYDETTLATALQLVSDDATITMAEGGTALSGLSLDVAAPVAGQVPQATLESSDLYDGALSWNCSTGTFQGDTVYTATIKLVAKEGYTFFEDIVPEVKGATVESTVLSGDDGRNASVLLIKAQFAKTESASGSGSASGSNSSDSSSGSGTKSSSGSATTSSSGSSSSSSQGASSGTTSSSTGSSSSSNTSSSSSDIKEATAFTIVSDADATVSISVDEADILSVEKGQDVTVSFDAIEGQEFDGAITKVSASTSSSSSGSTKYTATVTLDKTDDMMFGMSASATIKISESDNAVVIPISALQERGSSSFVYTQLDLIISAVQHRLLHI